MSSLKNSGYYWTLYLLLFTLISPAYSQLSINEFMASNATTLSDKDYGQFSDWIEIHNAGSTAVNLNGYFLTDDLNNPTKWLIAGDLWIAANGFQLFWADGNSFQNHVNFKLGQNGESIGLYGPALNPIDTFSYPLQKTDISMGRNPALPSEWLYFAVPTPNAPNGTDGYTGFVNHTPDFSVVGGLFDQSVTVNLTTDRGGEVHYTTDGSEPGLFSPIFSTPLVISTTTIIRARIMEAGKGPGPIVTHSYFINENLGARKLPVISVVSEPANFWDSTQGIYVQNFKPDWEIPINIEFFENNGSDRAGFNEQAGAKINGLNSWILPQKMLGIYFRNRYGSGSLSYPLFFDGERTNFESFALRASGSDWSFTLFRDILGQDITRENMNVDYQDFRPSIVYFNGQYMGIHNIRPKIDGSLLEETHGVARGTYDMIENEVLAEEGTMDEYLYFKSMVQKDLSIQANYDAVANLMDIENFTDYIITELYVGNVSIGHNVMAWKPKNTGKWRWILMDLDRGFIRSAEYLTGFFDAQPVLPFHQLMKNPGYREYFGKRLANHMLTTFHPERVKKIIDDHKSRIEAEIANHVARWKGTTSSYGNAIPSVASWLNQVNILKIYADERPYYLLSDLANYGFDIPVNLILARSQTMAGSITMNGHQVPDSTICVPYIQNQLLELEARSKPGYQFAGWKTMNKSSIVAKGSAWKYLDNGSDQGTAWRQLSFDDIAWKTGNGELGYGDGDETTVLGYGVDSNAKHITTYFRKKFMITASDLNSTGFTLSLKYDDGAIIYVNGTELTRANMNINPATYTTHAYLTIAEPAES
ncbi:MAG: CotH kinase family protein, partial [Cyclobacteriaceae bacterium]|nr:CotH kinase family protein [Cyclobacteriaceae bacterium]